MVRILLFLLLVNFALADVLGTVRSFMDSKTYHSKQNLIKSLFKDESQFIKEDGKIDSIAITNVLRENGLLKLSYSDAKEQIITFNTTNNPLLFMKIANDTFQELGYTYFITKNISKHGKELSWTISISTQNLIDPAFLTQGLKKQHCLVLNIKKTAPLHWEYSIDAKNAKLKTVPILLGQRKVLKRPNGAYWLKVANAKEAQINSNIQDNWQSKITFFDKHLKPISERLGDKKERNIFLKIPQDAYYMRLTDQFSLWNIKHGLAIRLN